jgi:carbonic anhydrase/acetyltransferase-like protein (isoleucine patch superfamily)
VESYLSIRPKIDDSVFVHPSAVIIGDVTLAAGCSIWPCASLRGDDGPIVVGEDCAIQDGVVLHGTLGRSATKIGARVTIGHRAIVHSATIGSDCLIGMGAIVLDDAVIDPFCLIGAATLVTSGQRFASGTLILGSPARAVRQLTEQELAYIAMSWQRYRQQRLIYRGELGSPPNVDVVASAATICSK